MDWLERLPPQALLALLVLGVIVVAVTVVVAIVQGRELSFWPPRLGARPGTAPAPPGEPEDDAPIASPFSGLWEHVWGWLAIFVDDYDATRFERNVAEEGAGGHLVLRTLEGTWRNADGTPVSQSAKRMS
jgi:hypothetical protein